METKDKFIFGSTIVGFLSLACILGYIIKQQHDTITALTNNKADQQLLKDHISKTSEVLLTQKAFEDKMNNFGFDMNTIKDQMKQIDGRVTTLISSSSSSTGTNVIGTGSSRVEPIPENTSNPNPEPNICGGSNCYEDKYGYHKNIQLLDLNENFDQTKIPVGSVSFNSTQQKPWSYTILPRTYQSKTMIATDKNDKKTSFTKMSIIVDGKTYDLPAVKSEISEQLPESQFYFWNPRIMFGLDAGISTKPAFALIPELQFYIASYGKTRQLSDWHFVGLGVGYDIVNLSLVGSISPFMYKPTSDSSMFQNIYIGPTISFDVNKIVYAAFGFRVSL